MKKESIQQRVATLWLALCMLLGACQDFEELNTNPTKAPDIDPNAQLAYAQLFAWGDWEIVQTYHFYCAVFAQQMQGEWAANQYGGLYRLNNEYMNSLWQHIYTSPLKNLTDVISRTEDDVRYRPLCQMARITAVYYYMVLTDLYGDIPYDEAGQGFLEDIVTPVYNTQQYIYHDMIATLREASEVLAAGGEGLDVTGDIIYGGNRQAWCRLANSLRLRAAMRLVKVEPETARAEVAALMAAGGEFIREGEDALIAYENYVDWNNEYRRNALAQLYRGRETFPCCYLCSTLWDMLRSKEDPRTLRIARCYSEAGYSSIPMGRVDITDEMLEKVGWSQFQPVKPGYFWYDLWPSGYYSSLTRTYEMKACRPVMNNAFLNTDNPGVIMTYAEVQLLLAEAALRWGADAGLAGRSQACYEHGVKAAMELLTRFKVTPVTDTEITDYLAGGGAFPDDVDGQLRAINEELWILHLTNAPEAYANWRRSGYPRLQPSGYYGVNTVDSREIPRRLTYPVNEAAYNSASYAAAIEALGGQNSWNARVWWDAETE